MTIVYDKAADLGDAIADALQTDKVKDAVTKLLEDMSEVMNSEIQSYVIDQMPERLAGFVRDMAERTVTAIINGNEKEVKRYLCLDGWTGRTHDHDVIHGDLFEPNTIEVRRKIAQAHADLIANARILDLEAQLEAMVKRVRERDERIARMEARY